MSYADLRELWDALGGSVDEARAALLDHRGCLELIGEPGGELLTGTGDEHVLVVIALDAAGQAALAVVPAALVDAPLAQALAAIDGRTFAGAADLTRAQWDAAVLVMSALALELGSADELARWAADEGSSLTPAEVGAAWDRWRDTGVTSWAELARPISRVYAFRRAM